MSTRLTTRIIGVLGACILVANGMTTLSRAQIIESWNRKVEAFSVTPSVGAAADLFDIRAFISLSTTTQSTVIDLGTEMVILVNGERYSVQQVVPEAGNDNLVATQPGVPLQPEDEIMVLLRPSPGAAPEPNQADDSLVQPFNGLEICWNRKIVAMSIVPTPTGAGATLAGGLPTTYDVQVEADVQASYDGALNLASELELRINGVPTAHSPSASDWLVFNPCVECGLPCAFTLEGEARGSCEIQNEDLYCPCRSPGFASMTFLAVPAEPGDIIEVILRPVPGALPELPGFPDDDEEREPVPSRRNLWVTYDCNGDGTVDLADAVCHLAYLFSGGPEPACQEAMDFNDDGLKDLTDPIAALAHQFNGGPPPPAGSGCQVYPSCEMSEHCAP